MKFQSLLQAAISLAERAGKVILEVYYSENFDVTLKSPDSPLTRADIASHSLIVEELTKVSDLPVLSEESKTIPHEERAHWGLFWLVDPLDGTKEFIKRNGEFTVNIALIQGVNPVLGVIHAPVPGTTYYSLRGMGAFKQRVGEAPVPLRVCKKADKLRIVASRSHRGPELESFLAKTGEYECVSVGSSLKFCVVAEGEADLYPRLGPTMEWDTAAGQCIAEEAGAEVTDLHERRLTYNKPNLLNPEFIVNGASVHWQDWLDEGSPRTRSPVQRPE
jgi:3'(2'), 5'-bisphosphate nucleotidase